MLLLLGGAGLVIRTRPITKDGLDDDGDDDDDDDDDDNEIISCALSL